MKLYAWVMRWIAANTTAESTTLTETRRDRRLMANSVRFCYDF
ncbi:hypothetical protein [Chroococcidiopsis sp.]